MKQKFLLLLFVMYLIKLSGSSHFEKDQLLSTLSTFNEIQTKSSIRKLHSGQILNQGGVISSLNDEYDLVMQSDGNLVLFDGKTNSPIWSSNTAGKGQGPYRLALLYTGNIIILDKYNGMLWATVNNDTPSDKYSLIVEDNGNVIVINEKGSVIWDLNGLSHPMYGNEVHEGQIVSSNQYLVSPNRQFKALLQENGNFEVINEIQNRKVYSTQTAGQGQAPYKLKLDFNGVLSVMDNKQKNLWSTKKTNSTSAIKSYTLTLANDGLLRIIDHNNHAVWVSELQVISEKNLKSSSKVKNDAKNTLSPGNNLTQGHSLISSNGIYNATLLSNGEFILQKTTSAKKNQLVWNSDSSSFDVITPNVTLTVWSSHSENKGNGPYRLILQENGVLDILDSNNTRIWKSHLQIGGSAGNYILTVTDDGNLIISNATVAVWDILGFVQPSAKLPNHISAGHSLKCGHSLSSANGRYTLDLQLNGNLVLNYYADNVSNPLGKRAIWETNTGNIGLYPCRLYLKRSGRFILLDSRNYILYHKKTRARNGRLQLTDNGHLQIIDSHNKSHYDAFDVNPDSHNTTLTNFTSTHFFYRAVLYVDQDLRTGSSLLSKNQKFQLKVTDNCDLKLYHYPNTLSNSSQQSVVWNVNVTRNASGPCRLHLGNDGNLVVFDNKDKALWQSNSQGELSNVYYLILNDEGELKLLNTLRPRLFLIAEPKIPSSIPVDHDSHISTPPQVNKSIPIVHKQHKKYEIHSLIHQRNLKKGVFVVSKNKLYALTVLDDGHLHVLFINKTINNSHTHKSVWHSNNTHNGTGPFKAKLLGTGNLVLYDHSGLVLWQSLSVGSLNSTYKVEVEDDGNVLIVRNRDLAIVWEIKGKYQHPQTTTHLKPRPPINKQAKPIVVKNDTTHSKHKPVGAKNITQPKKHKLFQGESITGNQSLYSFSEKFQLTINSLGNIVITNVKTHKTVWSSNVKPNSKGPFFLTLSNTGNLILRDSTNHTLWQSNSGGRPNKDYMAMINGRGSLVVYKNKNQAIWDSQGKVAKQADKFNSNSLPEGAVLKSDNSLYSKNKKYTLDLNTDGNLLLYKHNVDYNTNKGKILIWESKTKNLGVAPFKLIMRPNGNLVLLDKKKKVIWSTKTKGKQSKKGYKASLLDNGLFVVRSGKQIIWDNQKGIHKISNLLKKPKHTVNTANSTKHTTSQHNQAKPHKNLNNTNHSQAPHKNQSKTHPMPKNESHPFTYNSQLNKNKPVLLEGEALISANRFYSLRLEDGNIVILYHPNSIENIHNAAVVWSSNTHTNLHGPFHLTISKKGALIVLNEKGKKAWSNGNKRKEAEFFAVLENDGNFAVYKQKNNKPIWDAFHILSKNKVTITKGMKPVLLSGKSLSAGKSLYSDNLKYSLEIQNDGNIFVFHYPKGINKDNKERRATWSSNSRYPKKTGFQLTLTPEGTLILKDKKSKILWKSNFKLSKPSKKLYLKLLNDGNLVLLDKKAEPVWDLFTAYYQHPKRFSTNTLLAGQHLKMGQSLFSSNGKFSLDLQYDGNAVIYEYPSGKGHFENRKPIWNTSVTPANLHNSPYKLKLKLDGNLVLINHLKGVLWDSKSHLKKGMEKSKISLVLTDKGKLKIQTKKGKIVWTSK